MAERKNGDSFIVVLPNQIIEIPHNSYLSWLTLFYALPKELVAKQLEYLELPRKPYELLHSDKYKALIKNDAFLELVWDCYAWSVWQFFKIPTKNGYRDIPGKWSSYSGNFPLWKLSYIILNHLRNKFETEMEWSFQKIFTMPSNMEIPWLTYQQFSNLIGNLTDMIVEEQNWQPMIDSIWRNRQPEDYDDHASGVKRNFTRSWTHSKKYKHISLDEIIQNADGINDNLLLEIPEPRADFETKILSEVQKQKFLESLSDVDKEILELRIKGCTLQQIAAELEYKTPSAIHKRIKKIAMQYEDFVTNEYGKFLGAHSKKQDK